MKKALLISSTLLAFAASAQNEWNSMSNSTNPMFRKGNVAIGTSAPNGSTHFVVQDPGGSGTRTSLGTNGLIGSYSAGQSILELTSPLPADGIWFSMNAGSGSNKSFVNMGLSTTFGFGIYSGKGASGVTVPTMFYSDGPSGLIETMRIAIDGKISIGAPSATPGSYKLYVKQGILTEKVKVAIDGTANWSDYVFAPEYKLKTIEEVAAFIKTNKHLPGVPSATEMVKEGLDVATMDAKLLEKIEEMMLYIIDLKQEVELLKKENTTFKSSK